MHLQILIGVICFLETSICFCKLNWIGFAKILTYIGYDAYLVYLLSLLIYFIL